MNCVIQDGILKAAFYLPDHLRLDGDKPAYEVFLDKENRQFLTYDHLEKKWRDAKLDRLESVSYTHLDVYKRQLPAPARQRCSRPSWKSTAVCTRKAKSF